MTPHLYSLTEPERALEYKQGYKEGYEAGKASLKKELKALIATLSSKEPFTTFTSSATYSNLFKD